MSAKPESPNLRVVGKRKFPKSNPKRLLAPTEWLIANANQPALTALNRAEESGRNALITMRAEQDWLASAFKLVDNGGFNTNKIDLFKDGEIRGLDRILDFVFDAHTVLYCDHDAELPEAFEALASGIIDVSRIAPEDVNALFEDRFPENPGHWPPNRWPIVGSQIRVFDAAVNHATSGPHAIELFGKLLRQLSTEHVADLHAGIIDLEDSDGWTSASDGKDLEESGPVKAEPKAELDPRIVKAMKAVEFDEPTGPLLKNLAGYGAAATWAADLAVDIQEYRDGEIEWQDVDQGCLLVGPPGTGKTLFAKALAATTGLPLIATSYAIWQSYGDGHLGTVIQMIRATFTKAEAIAPCILFIDEIDAIRGRRAAGDRDSGWWTPIVAALLECLDGISRVEGIVTIGACNYAETLDSAMLRSGRLDRRFDIGLPDEAALLQILRHHAVDVSVADLEPIAVALAGTISGADVARIAREAKRLARRGKRPMTGQDMMSVALPAETRPTDQVWRTAVHEAGHTVAYLVSGHVPEALSTVNGDGMQGHVRGLGDGFRQGRLVDLEGFVMPMLAGRAAEDVILGEASAGASSDLEMASGVLQQIEGAFGLGGTLTPGGPDRTSVEVRLRRIYGEAILVALTHRIAIIDLARLAVERRVLSKTVLSKFADERGLMKPRKQAMEA